MAGEGRLHMLASSGKVTAGVTYFVLLFQLQHPRETACSPRGGRRPGILHRCHAGWVRFRLATYRRAICLGKTTPGWQTVTIRRRRG